MIVSCISAQTSNLLTTNRLILPYSLADNTLTHRLRLLTYTHKGKFQTNLINYFLNLWLFIYPALVKSSGFMRCVQSTAEMNRHGYIN